MQIPPPMAEQLARAILPLMADDPLSRAIHLFRQQQVAALPVLEHGLLAGWITEAQVAAVLTDDASAVERPLREWLAPPPAVLSPFALPEDALAVMQATESSLLPIMAPDGQYLGCLARVDVLATRTGRLTPVRLGGMATPLGVYLTTGSTSGGAGELGLMLSGMMMAVMLWLAQTVLLLGSVWLANHTSLVFIGDIALMLSGHDIDGSTTRQLTAMILSSGALMLMFMLLLRFAPLLSGFHAAEHQTVNAIEQGEPLTVEAVGRMSRVHPRCGTNLWAIMALCYLAVSILSLALTTKIAHQDIGLVVMLAVVMLLVIAAQWRHVGGWLQEHFTTRPATDAELRSGIRAGEEVLLRHQQATSRPPHRVVRIWQMGLAQVLIGVILMQYLLSLLDTRLDLLWQNLVK